MGDIHIYTLTDDVTFHNTQQVQGRSVYIENRPTSDVTISYSNRDTTFAKSKQLAPGQHISFENYDDDYLWLKADPAIGVGQTANVEVIKQDEEQITG